MTRTGLILFIVLAAGCQRSQDIAYIDGGPEPLTYETVTRPVWVGGDPHAPGSYVEPYRFELDIDHDGVPELFVQCPLSRGNAGADHTIYRRSGDRYVFLGDLFFHPRAFRVLEPTEEHAIRVMYYSRHSGTEGTVVTLGHDGERFEVLERETIYPGDGGTALGQARYTELFGR